MTTLSGNRQAKEEIDLYSPTPRLSTVRVLLHQAVEHGWAADVTAEKGDKRSRSVEYHEELKEMKKVKLERAKAQLVKVLLLK